MKVAVAAVSTQPNEDQSNCIDKHSQYVVITQRQNKKSILFRTYEDFYVLKKQAIHLLKGSSSEKSQKCMLAFEGANCPKLPNKTFSNIMKQRQMLDEIASELGHYLVQLIRFGKEYRDSFKKMEDNQSEDSTISRRLARLLTKFLEASADDENTKTQTKSPSKERTTLVEKSTCKSVKEDLDYRIQRSKTVDAYTSDKKDTSKVLEHAREELGMVFDTETVGVILRFIDKLLMKASMKSHGCYRVDSKKMTLEIDAERFVDDLATAFPEILVSSAKELFCRMNNEWKMPIYTKRYIDTKWKSFRKTTSFDLNKSESSDEEDINLKSEIEYFDTRRIKQKENQHKLADDQIDCLDQLIADGIAGKDQILALQRQRQDGYQNYRAVSALEEYRDESSDGESESGSDSETEADDDEEDKRILAIQRARREKGDTRIGKQRRGSKNVSSFQIPSSKDTNRDIRF